MHGWSYDRTENVAETDLEGLPRLAMKASDLEGLPRLAMKASNLEGLPSWM